MGLVNLNPSSVAVNVAEDIRNSDTVTAVSAAATVTVALAANPLRGSYSIYNAGTQTVFVRENATVSATLYKHPIPPGYLFEQDLASSRYTGVVSVITASGTSSIMVAESTIAS
ncbi:hypothetical protein [Microcoleus asticus]|uniref:Uncharacterized protein n=1 Tax=Microcoleus asticus IPMA8 TaxID=2563858 RepID=A0ABX2D6S4_9CYAN|nr:hypothetical protein [Microcoleus asticus]NQE38365.1 hypothetical protein [Microcoleus asticus IPMA8]